MKNTNTSIASFTPNRAIIAMLWVVAIGIVLYWISYFSEGSVHASAEACYHSFQRNFPAPDAMIAFMCILCAEGLRRSKPWSIFTGMAAVGGLLFLALIDISYNLWNDMYLMSSSAIGAEIVINVVCLSTAACLWLYLYKHRNALLHASE
ncbi:MAG: hypothetical protein ACI90U_002990 [Pseudomonadales bacterium]